AQVNEKAVVYRFFKRHLPAIKPLWDDFSNDERVFSFQGQSDNFQFVSVFPASSGRKGLHIFEVALDKAEKTTIKVLLKPFYPSAEQGQQWQEETVILLENVAEFELSYFDKKKTGSWQANWQDKKYLPELIKINIVQSDESYWPEMIFALKIKAKNTNINQDKLG
ncbi:MAG: prepilin-type cleavage/methylation domain-containing protein, partial [Gammaproteobacteria bacterium]|nr:prepilin-type cleavage/methylation domain-containing protein [Gammaproteobacteria bacterium]